VRHNLLNLCREFLIIQINHLVFMAVGIAVMGIMKQENAMFFPWLLVSVVPLFHYLLRVKISKIYIFFPLQFLIPVLFIFIPIPNIVFKVLVCITAFLYAAWSSMIKINGSEPFDELFQPIFTVIAIGVISIVQSYFGYESWSKYYMGMVFAALLCYFLHVFLERYQNFIHVNQYSASNIPEKAIFKVGLKQSCIYTGLCLILLLLSANLDWFAYVFKAFLYGVLFVVRTLLVWLGGDSTMDLEPEKIVTENVDTGGGPPMSGGTTFLLWRILEYIILPAVTIAIIVAIFYGIFRLLKYIFEKFHRYSLSQEAIAGGIDVRETVEIEKGERGVLKLFSFKNNRDKVRKLFKRYVLKEKNRIIGDAETERLHFITAKECCEKLTAEELSRVYDKARYSEDTITTEDLKVLKNI